MHQSIKIMSNVSDLQLDDLLKGGVESQAITELTGEFGSGKSQICHTLCVTAAANNNSNQINSIIFIDTENTFRPERIHQIAEARGLDSEEIMKKVFVCKIVNSAQLEALIKNLGKSIEEYKAKLVIMDSIISLHRAEYAGRETLAERQQRLVYTFLVNCILPVKQRHGFESMAVCMNNTDYNDQRKTAALNPEKIGVASKCAGIDPKIVFKNLYVHPTYNQQHQLSVAEEIAEIIESDKDIKLLVVHHITKFFKESKNKMESGNILKQVIGIISKACAKNKVSLICTGDANTTARGIIPRPIGGIYLKHAANVIIHLKEYSKTSATIPSFKATLIKHQYTKTPKSAVLYVRKTGGMMLLD